MSLVEYEDSSSDDDVLAAEEQTQTGNNHSHSHNCNENPLQLLQIGSERCEQEESVEKLPDALLLLEYSPTLAQVTGGDHDSVVAAAMAESALRKIDLNGNASSPLRRPKIPRGNLPHSKNNPETSGNVLVPPQLKGRSNVATEDMSRLFVKKRQAPDQD